MPTFSRQTQNVLLFLPGLLILVIGMFALHASVRLSYEHKELELLYSIIPTQQEAYGLPSNTEIERKIKTLSAHIQRREDNLYWAVLAIGLTAFLLLVLNADKLSRLASINERRRKELTLLEHRLAAIEASFEGIGIVDVDGNLTYMNKALLDLYGIQEDKKDEYLGQSWLALYTPENQQYIREQVVPVYEENGFWRDTARIMHQNDTTVMAELSMTRLDDGGFIGTARDITEKEKATAEKKEIQEQLLQAQKMEAVGRLAGGIAHDFNNILAAMNGYAEFLIEDLEENSPQNQFAKNILQAGGQARALIDQILAFSRRHNSKTENIDLCVPINESLSMLKAALPKAIEVETDFQTDSVIVEGNATQISQMMMNLGVNASDAMRTDEAGHIFIGLSLVEDDRDMPAFHRTEEGVLPDLEETPLIRIEDGASKQTLLHLGSITPGHDYAKLTVKDNGTGMNRVIMEHIFEPFFTTKDVHKGTGLGLASVHGTMTAHRGALYINSMLGQGTCFELYFPLSDGEIETQEESAEEVVVIEGQNILLVEDQLEVQLMTATMLERMGYKVECAESGMEALDLLRERPGEFDLVLTDQNMPKMSGLELIKQTHLDFPDMPFVLLSGYSEERLQDLMAEHRSIRAVVRKPVAQKTLAKILAEVLLEDTKLMEKKAASA